MSLVKKPPERVGPPSEKAALSWVFRIADRMSAGRVRAGSSATVQTTDGVVVVESEAWRVGDSMCAWLDLPAFGDDSLDIPRWGMAVGFREWHDAGVLFTWIAGEGQVGSDPDVRAMFESLARAF